METIFQSYFENLFSSTIPSSNAMDNALQDIQQKVTSYMNAKLLAPFTRGDIERAIKQMYPSKAPGPDGFSSLFYQQYWSEVCDATVLNCLEILNQSRSVSDWNFTYIALIPKLPNPKKVSDFRPISLCNVAYKIIAKVLVNRMKGVLQDIILENQSAFVPGRSIFTYD